MAQAQKLPSRPEAAANPSQSMPEFIRSTKGGLLPAEAVLASVSLREPEKIAALAPDTFAREERPRGFFDSPETIARRARKRRPDLLFSKLALDETRKLALTNAQEFAERPRVAGTTLTIDAYSSQDLDDGLSFRREGNHDVVTVSAADVTAWIEAGSALDFSARQRAESKYRKNYTLPMFPVPLAEDLFSLHHGVDRLAITCEMRFDSDSKELVGHEWKLTVFNNQHRLNKTDAAAARQDPSAAASPELHEALRGLSTVTHVANGGDAKDPIDQHPNMARMLQHFIVSSSALLAKDLSDAGLETSYRNQTEANTAASYGPRPKGHASMGLDQVVRWTSGIRRYADLDVHRTLKALLDGSKPNGRALEIGRRMREIQHRRDNRAPIGRSGEKKLEAALRGANAALPNLHMTRRARHLSSTGGAEALSHALANYGIGPG